MKKIVSFDCDGVLTLPIKPVDDNYVVITGRSLEEEKETLDFLRARGIDGEVFFNPVKFNEKTRKSSGLHKARVLLELLNKGFEILMHFEDDPVQIDIIKTWVPEVPVIHVNHNGMVELENVRRDSEGNEIKQ